MEAYEDFVRSFAKHNRVKDVLLLIKNLKEQLENIPPTISDLHKTAKEGNVVEVNRLLSKGVDVNGKDEHNWTSLMIASRGGHFEIVRNLIKNGAGLDVNNQEISKNRTALMWAAIEGHAEIVQFLLEKGADPDMKDMEGWTALIWAASRGYSGVVQVLIKKGADVNLKTSSGATALYRAASASQSQIDTVNALIHADPDTAEFDGTTALMWAAQRGDNEVVDALLDSGADFDSIGPGGWTAFFYAVSKGHRHTVYNLIERGAYSNTKDDSGRTALVLAKEENRSGVVELLLDSQPIFSEAKQGKPVVEKGLFNKGKKSKVSFEGLSVDELFLREFDYYIREGAKDGLNRMVIYETIVAYANTSSRICKELTINKAIATKTRYNWVTKDRFGNIIRSTPSHESVFYIDVAMEPLLKNADKAMSWAFLGNFFGDILSKAKQERKGSKFSGFVDRIWSRKKQMSDLFKKMPCRSSGLRRFQSNLIRYYEMQE